VLLLAWGGAGVAVSPALELGLSLVDGALGRTQAEVDLADLAARVDNAQHLADMGDYDWHIASDTNRWSDQLFRIYGHEPGAFNPSYERFLGLIHPDDRERITAVHQEAYRTGEPYQMVERIVRPDGSLRYLSSNGEVVLDEGGTPVRMRGTCIDITDRVLAEQEREHHAARFRALVEHAPDAILVLDADGHVLDANPRARVLLGGELVGLHLGDLLPGAAHEDARGVPARTVDGRELAVDATWVAGGQLDGEQLDALFLRDAAVRVQGEELAARLGEAQLRRKQALEINDNVVQGLVAAAYALEQGDQSATSSYLERTLSAARGMMDDLLEPLDGEGLSPGDLVRSAPTSLGRPVAPPSAEAPATAPRRVLLVDDSDDLRALLRMRLENRDGFTVVGEAADGLQAVARATELRPDLVMLDLAMPRMDGLEALPLLKEAVPGVRVIVLSGFNQAALAQKAVAAGADRYVVKGGPTRALLDTIHEVLGAPA
jgi:PAS domain S-box-containing protein